MRLWKMIYFTDVQAAEDNEDPESQTFNQNLHQNLTKSNFLEKCYRYELCNKKDESFPYFICLMFMKVLV